MKKTAMILNISPLKSFLASITSAIAGTSVEYISRISTSITIEAANTAFQHAAWTIAILAGLISALNGVLTACDKIRNWKSKPK